MECADPDDGPAASDDTTHFPGDNPANQHTEFQVKTWTRAAFKRLARVEIYAVRICPFDGCTKFIAVASGASILVFELRGAGTKIQKVGEYCIDPECSRADETFYVCEWGLLSDGTLTIFAAGLSGHVHVICAATFKRIRLLQGHGGAVNTLAVSPAYPDLLLSASADEGVRLWNVKSGMPLAMFAGKQGHLGEVLSLAWCLTRPHLFASAGMDDSVLIWSMQQVLSSGVSPATDIGLIVSVPVLSARHLHHDYVDCVAWYGDLLLSKSVHNEIVLWGPARPLPGPEQSAETPVYGSAPATALHVVARLSMDHCSLWFVRFAVHSRLGLVACGNTRGHVYVWRLKADGAVSATAGEVVRTPPQLAACASECA